MTHDLNGDEPGVAVGAKISGEIREHAVEQLMSVGRLSFGLVRGLAELRTGVVEFVAAGTVIEPVDTSAVRALFGHVGQQAQDEVLSLEREGCSRVFLGMGAGNGHTLTVVGANAPFRKRTAPDVASDILEHAANLRIGRVNLHVPLLTAQLVEQVQALLHAHSRRRNQDLIGGLDFAGCGVRLEVKTI